MTAPAATPKVGHGVSDGSLRRLARCRRRGEGPVTEPTTPTQPWWRQPLFMPQIGPSEQLTAVSEPVGKSARRYSEQMLRLGGLHQFIEEIRMSEAHQCVDALGR